MMRSALTLAGPVVALGLIASGCGSDASSSISTETRQAAAGEWPTRVVCDEHNSFAFTMSIQNLLLVAVAPAAKDIDCADWSGISTPPMAFNGSTIPVGHPLAGRRLHLQTPVASSGAFPDRRHRSGPWLPIPG
jgi:hypothetical protein